MELVVLFLNYVKNRTYEPVLKKTPPLGLDVQLNILFHFLKKVGSSEKDIL